MICLPGTLFYIILCQNPIIKWNVPLNDLSPWYIALHYSSPKSDRKVDPPAERIPSLARRFVPFLSRVASVKWAPNSKLGGAQISPFEKLPCNFAIKDMCTFTISRSILQLLSRLGGHV